MKYECDNRQTVSWGQEAFQYLKRALQSTINHFYLWSETSQQPKVRAKTMSFFGRKCERGASWPFRQAPHETVRVFSANWCKNPAEARKRRAYERDKKLWFVKKFVELFSSDHNNMSLAYLWTILDQQHTSNGPSRRTQLHVQASDRIHLSDEPKTNISSLEWDKKRSESYLTSPRCQQSKQICRKALEI